MAIANAVVRGSYIYVYDEKGKQLCTIPGTELAGFTSTTVNVRRGSRIYIFDEKGKQTGTMPG